MTIRTFIALDLPEANLEAIFQLQQEFRKTDTPVSWVNVSRVHLTLKFLGDISEEMVPRIEESLTEIASRANPFLLQPVGCGAFPNVKQMRVIWVGLGGDFESLQGLQKEVESAMIPFGFKEEDRPFRPHLTLGRVKGRRGLHALQEKLLTHNDFQSEPFKVTEIVLYRSDLRPDGARYTALFRAPFSG